MDKSPSKRPRAYTRRSHLRNPWPTRQSLSQLWKLRSGLSEPRFKKPAPLSDSSEDDLLFAVGIALIRLATHLHASMTFQPFSPRTPIRPALVHACLAHACTRSAHASARCRSTGSPSQAKISSHHATSSCHVAGKKKLVRRNRAFYDPNSSSRPLWPRLEAKFS